MRPTKRTDHMKILLVDDEADVVDALTVAARFHWRDVTVIPAYSGDQALALFYQHEPDVVVLDVSMPGMNGFDVLAQIRRTSDVAVLLLTGRVSEADQVRGLELGADQYVVKPFSHLVLLARIRSMMRRARAAPPARALPDFTAGSLTIDFELRQVHLAGRVVELAPAEYRLLYHLARNPGHFLSHEALLERIWHGEWGASNNNLKALVSRLRGKVEPNAASTRYIENQRGVGYRLVVPSPKAAAAQPEETSAGSSSSHDLLSAAASR
jgi:DNA-binding response OmpR family regulator